MAWSPDSRRLATTGDDGTVRIWLVDPHNALRSEQARPITLVARWLHAIRDADRRERLWAHLYEREGWTKSAMAVIEAAFERAIATQMATTKRWPDPPRLTAALQAAHPEIEFDPAKVHELLPATITGTASQVTGLSPTQRLLMCTTGFTVSVHQMGLPASDLRQLIIDAEQRTLDPWLDTDAGRRGRGGLKALRGGRRRRTSPRALAVVNGA